MEQVERADTEMQKITYRGEHEGEDGEIVNEGVLDLICYREEPGRIFSFWKPTGDELAVLNAGGHVQLGIHTEPIPPVSLVVVEPPAGAPNHNGRVG